MEQINYESISSFTDGKTLLEIGIDKDINSVVIKLTHDRTTNIFPFDSSDDTNIFIEEIKKAKAVLKWE